MESGWPKGEYLSRRVADEARQRRLSARHKPIWYGSIQMDSRLVSSRITNVRNGPTRVYGPYQSALVGLAGIKGVAQTVTNIIDGQHRQENQGAGEDGFVRIDLQVVVGTQQHRPPRWHIGREPEPQE